MGNSHSQGNIEDNQQGIGLTERVWKKAQTQLKPLCVSTMGLEANGKTLLGLTNTWLQARVGHEVVKGQCWNPPVSLQIEVEPLATQVQPTVAPIRTWTAKKEPCFDLANQRLRPLLVSPQTRKSKPFPQADLLAKDGFGFDCLSYLSKQVNL